MLAVQEFAAGLICITWVLESSERRLDEVKLMFEAVKL